MGGGEEPLDRLFAGFGLAAERELAVDDRAAEAAFGAVVGRLDAVDLAEGPQRRPDFEQVAGEPAGALVRGGLAGVAVEEWFQLGLQRGDPLAQLGAVAVCLEVVPGLKEARRDLESCLAEALLGLEPFALGGEVADQV